MAENLAATVEVGHLVEILANMSAEELAIVQSALIAENTARAIARDRLVKTVRQTNANAIVA